MILYEGDGFKIIDDDGIEVFQINTPSREITYSFLKDAIDEYERNKKESPK